MSGSSRATHQDLSPRLENEPETNLTDQLELVGADVVSTDDEGLVEGLQHLAELLMVLHIGKVHNTN